MMTFAIFSKSSLSIIEPVGLFGKGNISIFVFSVIAFKSSSLVSLNSFSALRFIITGFAFASKAQGS